ncbi:O-succinylbenzoic acid--CoA ligase [Tenacibaculum sp. E3R01]|uniref:AMP-binding protein n=1 Tax=Tenacibaculum sp. E3R01 TaxID=2267227 RepID=UPI000DE971F6|nr:AMP-binding protein [Tenacibaculum sp. E3R01]RBW60373.1 O-succinylbenzoic acid--CoA ligase [Tenacibaculum sp. E3R01]
MNIDFQLNSRSFTDVEELLEYSKSLSVDSYHFFSNWFNDEDFIVVQTSGSTGTPKSIQLKKEHMRNSAIATGTFFNLKEKTTALLCMSTNYIAGKMMLVRALTLGWHINVVEPKSNPLDGIDKVYDFSAMVPLQLQASLNEIYRVKKLIVGGGVVSTDLVEKIQGISTEVFATYGMTETITHIAVKKLNNFSSSKNRPEQSFYKTLPNVFVQKDERQCLVIKASKVSEEIIITNDVIKLISETEFEWLGRYDNVINSGGIKLHPEVIEEKLSNILSQRFFVAGVSDTVLGEKLILIVEGKKCRLDLDKNILLSKYEYPKEVYFISEFIETETKKIQRKKTLDLLF